MGIVTSCAANIIYRLLSENSKDNSTFVSTSIHSVDRDVLADQVMSTLRADESMASNPLSQLLLATGISVPKEGKDSLLDLLLTRVVIMLRSKALPVDGKGMS